MIVHESTLLAPNTSDHLPAQSGRFGFAMVALAIITVVALVVRMNALTSHELEFDEYWNAELTVGKGSIHEWVARDVIHVPPAATALADAAPWWQILSNYQTVTHPPLFTVLLRWWREVFGDGDFATRSLGAVCSGLAVIPLYAAVAILSGRRAGLFAAAIFAVASAPVALSQQARPYNVLLLIACVTTWHVLRMARDGATWPRAIVLGLLSLLCVFTHYFSAAFLLAMAGYAAVKLDRRSLLRCVATVGVAAGVFAVLWGPVLISQQPLMRDAAGVWLKDVSEAPVLATLRRLCEAPIRLLATPPSSSSLPPALSILWVVAAGVMAVWRRDLRFWLLVLAGTLGFIALLDLVQQTRMLSYTRYITPAAPAMAALAACLLIRCNRWIATLVPAAIVVASISALPDAYRRYEPQYRPMAQALNAGVQAGDIVVFPVVDDLNWHAGFLYLTWSHYQTTPPVRCLFLTGPATPELLAKLTRARRVWVVTHAESTGLLDRLPGLQSLSTSEFPFVAVVTEAVLPTPAGQD